MYDLLSDISTYARKSLGCYAMEYVSFNQYCALPFAEGRRMTVENILEL